MRPLTGVLTMTTTAPAPTYEDRQIAYLQGRIATAQAEYASCRDAFQASRLRADLDSYRRALSYYIPVRSR